MGSSSETYTGRSRRYSTGRVFFVIHTIYHVLGCKVGCTSDFGRRITEYPQGTEFEILQELHDKTDKQAGDIEWEWADSFGYKRGQHYSIIASNEMRLRAAEGGRKGGQQTG